MISNFFDKFKNLKKISKIWKNHLFSKKSQNLKEKKKFPWKKNAILLVLLFEEISLRPELSSPPHLELLMDSARTWHSSNRRTSLVFNWIGMHAQCCMSLSFTVPAINLTSKDYLKFSDFAVNAQLIKKNIVLIVLCILIKRMVFLHYLSGEGEI